MANSNERLHTSIPKSDYTFSWTVENFHLTSSLKVRGAEFLPIPGTSEKFCFELAYKKYDIVTGHLQLFLLYLNENDKKNDLTVSGKICIANKEKVLFNPYLSVTSISPATILNNSWLKCSVRIPEVLSDGVLKVSGTLSFSNYMVTSRITSQQSSVNCCCKELASDMKTKYESSLSSGIITFTIDQKKITAHKAILCSGSPVFEKMFEHNMLENNTKKVTLTDVDFCTFNCFLAFLYTGVIKDDKYESLVSLYPVAKKYQVKSLQKSLFALLSNNLSVDYVCEALVLADLHGDKELKEITKIFARENFFDLAGTAKWAELVTTYPKISHEVMDFIKPNSK